MPARWTLSQELPRAEKYVPAMHAGINAITTSSIMPLVVSSCLNAEMKTNKPAFQDTLTPLCLSCFLGCFVLSRLFPSLIDWTRCLAGQTEQQPHSMQSFILNFSSSSVMFFNQHVYIQRQQVHRDAAAHLPPDACALLGSLDLFVNASNAFVCFTTEVSMKSGYTHHGSAHKHFMRRCFKPPVNSNTSLNCVPISASILMDFSLRSRPPIRLL